MAKERSVVPRLVGLGSLLAFLIVPSLSGQLEPAPEAGGGGPAAGAGASPGGKPAPSSTPLVVEARSIDRDHRDRAKLGDGLIVTVQNLRAAVERAPKGCEGLVLFLNEMPIQGAPPESCDLDTGEVRFTLDRTDESDRAWHALLEEPIAFQKSISVSVGPEGNLSYPSTVGKFKLIVLPELQLFGYFAGLLLALLVVIRLAMRTALLRDRTSQVPPGQLSPYSLSRFQLAFWSFLVIAAYLFIWMITEELDTITGSVLALLGIGSGTALGANLIDSGKPPASAAAAPEGSPPAAARSAVSQGFLRDVLSDEGGISLYRLQLFAWTLVLGVIFIASVYDGLQMPQFNPTLLGLMGISSGTYLGFKVPENQTPKA